MRWYHGLLTGCLLLVGCASSPEVRFFVLDGVEQTEPRMDEALYVTRVQVPEYLDSTRLWVRTDVHRMQRLPHVRWAENFPRALTRSLQEQLSGDVTEASADRRLLVDVRRFEARWVEGEDQVVLVAVWGFSGQEGSGQRTRLTASLDDRDPETLVAAQSRLWRELADAIAAAY